EMSALTPGLLKQVLKDAAETKQWLFENIYNSRAKDYQNEFRKMVYDTDAELEEVVGKLEDNAFINNQRDELEVFKKQIQNLISRFSL
ncbi:MAG TPA: hypothetical protein VM010_07715, partial [Chitinophagaceae bacterium]|nr:hypothetical protein [Chitinophagaceae bacterium]